jgi:PPOX class probable F420-dependent enzyme
MDETEARAFVARHHAAVLATIKRDGRPQLSNISYSLDDDGRIKISTTVDRAKTHNLRRDPRVTLAVQGENWHEYLVVEGHAEIVEGDVLAELRRVYERISGAPHPNWQEFDAAMIRDRRLILAITIERFYPLERARPRRR